MNDRQALSAARKMFGKKAWIEDKGPDYPHYAKSPSDFFIRRYQVGRMWLGIGEVLGVGDNWAEAIASAKKHNAGRI